jgi:hypothetical protein
MVISEAKLFGLPFPLNAQETSHWVLHEQRCRNETAFHRAEIFNFVSFHLRKDEVPQRTKLTALRNTRLKQIQLYAKTSESKCKLSEKINISELNKYLHGGVRINVC